jgi:hypothetical protein
MKKYGRGAAAMFIRSGSLLPQSGGRGHKVNETDPPSQYRNGGHRAGIHDDSDADAAEEQEYLIRHFRNGLRYAVVAFDLGTVASR